MSPMRFLLVFLLAAFVVSCSGRLPYQEKASSYRHPDSNTNLLVSSFRFSDVYAGDALDPEGLVEAARGSIAYWKRVGPRASFHYGKMEYGSLEMIDSMRLFIEIIEHSRNQGEVISRLDEEFLLFASSANDKNQGHGVLFTGYYEPIYEGVAERRPGYDVPVYAVPEDLHVLNLGRFRDSLKNKTIVYRREEEKLLPYYSREEIMAQGKLEGQGLEVAWMKSKVDLFFLQVQGSGILADPEGHIFKLGYAGANGRPYRSIGRYLVDKGRIPLEKISMQSIRAYLERHPEELDEVLHYNESYVFFKRSNGFTHPKGALNQPLTPERSIAADTVIFPKGSLAYFRTEVPHHEAEPGQPEEKPRSQFALLQDTGGAIKGPGRVDLFWGNGRLAEESAGRMKGEGRLYFLVAKKEAIQEARRRWSGR